MPILIPLTTLFTILLLLILVKYGVLGLFVLGGLLAGASLLGLAYSISKLSD